jgi:hypothetical protein
MPFGMKQGPDQVTTVTPNLTPDQQQLLSSAQAGVPGQAPGMTPGETSARDFWTNIVQQAGLAGRGLTGDTGAFGQFTSPAMSLLQPMFDRMRQTAQSQAGLATTSPFGINSRAGVQLAAANQGINEQEGQLTYQNAADTLNRMLSLIGGPGMGAAGALQNQGMFNRMLPLEWQQGRLGLLGPTGTTQRTPTQSSWLNTALGVGSLIAAPFTGGASLAAGGLLNEGNQPAPTAPGPTGNYNPSSMGWGIAGPSPYGGGSNWDPSSFAYGF